MSLLDAVHHLSPNAKRFGSATVTELTTVLEALSRADPASTESANFLAQMRARIAVLERGR